jgi:hypothetical protein
VQSTGVTALSLSRQPWYELALASVRKPEEQSVVIRERPVERCVGDNAYAGFDYRLRCAHMRWQVPMANNVVGKCKLDHFVLTSSRSAVMANGTAFDAIKLTLLTRLKD